MGADGKETAGKLRRYNERMFAVFGSLGAILFLMLLAMLTYSEVIKPLLWSSYERTAIMLSDKETQEAVEQGLRLQEASYELPRRLFDELPYYVIPVGQRTLAEPEPLKMFGGISFQESKSYYLRDSSHDTNNLIVWNRESGATEIVLPERRSVGSWVAYIENGIPYLLVLSEKIDTTLDAEDVQANEIRTSDVVLWVYALETGARAKIELSDKAGLELHTLDDSKLAFMLMGDYKEGSSFFDSEREPVLLYRVNARDGTLNPAVPDAIRLRIQNILDGVDEQAE
jgi:hypothetical protein